MEEDEKNLHTYLFRKTLKDGRALVHLCQVAQGWGRNINISFTNQCAPVLTTVNSVNVILNDNQEVEKVWLT